MSGNSSKGFKICAGILLDAWHLILKRSPTSQHTQIIPPRPRKIIATTTQSETRFT
ncbi:MAG: hypothetical protein ACSHYB_17510 [Roseibacillus sp.]